MIPVPQIMVQFPALVISNDWSQLPVSLSQPRAQLV